jgi:hypothetical protein
MSHSCSVKILPFFIKCDPTVALATFVAEKQPAKAFFRHHLVALKFVRFKGRVVNTEKGTKAVWVVFGNELRRTAIQKAIRKHNSSVDDSLKIQLRLEDEGRHLDDVIICSHDRKRLQKDKVFLFIISGKGQEASYWESDCNQ